MTTFAWIEKALADRYRLLAAGRLLQQQGSRPRCLRRDASGGQAGQGGG